MVVGPDKIETHLRGKRARSNAAGLSRSAWSHSCEAGGALWTCEAREHGQRRWVEPLKRNCYRARHAI